MMDHSTRSPGIAWITGAGTGIGRALAHRMAKEGWTIAISARTRSDLDALAAEAPGKIHPYPLDVTDADAVNQTANAIAAELGTIDLAIFNAGTYHRTSATNFDVSKFASMVELNIMGTLHCLSSVIPTMIARRGGHIAVVASVSGYVGLPGASGYGATKAALINLCESLKPELDAEGVQLQLINPGFVKTPLTDKNDFPMPFLIEVDDAVEQIVTGLKSTRFEIAFPWQMTLAIKSLRNVPHWLKFAVTRRMVRR